MRIDKLLANSGYGSRKEVKQLLKKGQVIVNGVEIKQPKEHVNPTHDVVDVLGERLHYQEFVYFMLNKPPGVVSATEDMRDETVIDLLELTDQVRAPFPVGRLDKDTEGLLLLTNDGKLAHKLLSPKKDVGKRYYANVKGQVTEKDIVAFKQGVTLDDGYHTKSAELTILESGESSEIELVISEGKFHQVKRMFEAVGKQVVYLKRLKMGELTLDPSLELGEYRELTEEELTYLQELK